jgi:hypothetical protein
MTDNYPIVMWQALVSDNVGHSKDFSTMVQLEKDDYKELMTNGPEVKKVMNIICFQGQEKVFSSGIDWRCVECGIVACKAVMSPALFQEDSPPRVVELSFLPICEKVSCGKKAYEQSQEALQDFYAQKKQSLHRRQISLGQSFQPP